MHTALPFIFIFFYFKAFFTLKLLLCFRDDDDVHGNPLVAGFQEDLAPDDEFKTSDRSISNAALPASASALRPSSKYKDSSSAKSGTTSVVKPSLDGCSEQVRKISGEPRRNPVVPDVTVNSSDDEMSECAVVVRQDDDISDEELTSEQRKGTVSSGPVRSAFYCCCYCQHYYY